MKIIVPIVFYRRGGVERVIRCTIPELAKQIDSVILVLPGKQIDNFRSTLPDSDCLIYETFEWPESSRSKSWLSWLYRFRSLSQKLQLSFVEERLNRWINDLRGDGRIRYLARKYGATHCLYFLINRLTPPKLNIPVAGISHDLFWRFSPLTYEESYVELYDRSLEKWLVDADLVFADSTQTGRDILSLFPQYTNKVKVVPLAGFLPESHRETIKSTSVEQTETLPIFFYPSTFGIYKDHLTLLRATECLSRNFHGFRLILAGKETDGLIAGTLELSQQKTTSQYEKYMSLCQQFYQKHREFLQAHCVGKGYVTHEELEASYQQSACVVVPSAYEGFGLAVAEAMVRGLPVICSDLPVFREQVELYGCGDRVTFFSVGDADALAERMADFLKNPPAKLSAEEAERRFSHWNWETIAREYINSLRSLNPNS